MLPQRHPKHNLSFGDEIEYLDIIRDFDKVSKESGDDLLWGDDNKSPIEGDAMNDTDTYSTGLVDNIVDKLPDFMQSENEMNDNNDDDKDD